VTKGKSVGNEFVWVDQEEGKGEKKKTSRISRFFDIRKRGRGKREAALLTLPAQGEGGREKLAI